MTAMSVRIDLRRWMRLCEAEDLHVIAYHGTPKPFSRFDTNLIGSMHDSGYLGRGFYFSASYNAAWSYAGENGVVLRCRLTLHSPLKVHSFSQFDYGNLIHDKKTLRQQGYDSVICAHYPRYPDDDHSTEIMVMSPEQIEVLDVLHPPEQHPEGDSADAMRDMMQQHRAEQQRRSEESLEALKRYLSAKR